MIKNFLEEFYYEFGFRKPLSRAMAVFSLVLLTMLLFAGVIAFLFSLYSIIEIIGWAKFFSPFILASIPAVIVYIIERKKRG